MNNLKIGGYVRPVLHDDTLNSLAFQIRIKGGSHNELLYYLQAYFDISLNIQFNNRTKIDHRTRFLFTQDLFYNL